jgi:hypothetical protein
MFTLQTSFKPLLLKRCGGVKSVGIGDCEKQGGKLVRLLSQLRPGILPQSRVPTLVYLCFSLMLSSSFLLVVLLSNSFVQPLGVPTDENFRKDFLYSFVKNAMSSFVLEVG